jgi:hypothetical protein
VSTSNPLVPATVLAGVSGSGQLKDAEREEDCILDLTEKIGWQYADSPVKARLVEDSNLVAQGN